MGKIGSNWLKIGTDFSGTAPVGGTLKLYYWDSNNYDNTEQIAASIDVNIYADGGPTPELSSASLLLLGMLPMGLAWWRRRKQ